MCVAMSALLCAGLAALSSAQEPLPRLEIETSEGTLLIELFEHDAPQTVSRFLERSGLSTLAKQQTPVRYAGTQLCESRAHGFLIFGCQVPSGEDPRPRASGAEPSLPDEIDAKALGLSSRDLGDKRSRDLLWQLEVYPRYQELRTAGRAVPQGLNDLMAGLRRRGMAGTVGLDGKSRRWYLEALGYRYSEGASGHPVRRGVLATASRWPGESDERFMIALSDMPERDGRATVFGRVIAGWQTIERIAAVSVDKSHVPVRPISILAVRPAPLSDEQPTLEEPN